MMVQFKKTFYFLFYFLALTKDHSKLTCASQFQHCTECQTLFHTPPSLQWKMQHTHQFGIISTGALEVKFLCVPPGYYSKGEVHLLRGLLFGVDHLLFQVDHLLFGVDHLLLRGRSSPPLSLKSFALRRGLQRGIQRGILRVITHSVAASQKAKERVLQRTQEITS